MFHFEELYPDHEIMVERSKLNKIADIPELSAMAHLTPGDKSEVARAEQAVRDLIRERLTEELTGLTKFEREGRFITGKQPITSNIGDPLSPNDYLDEPLPTLETVGDPENLPDSPALEGADADAAISICSCSCPNCEGDKHDHCSADEQCGFVAADEDTHAAKRHRKALFPLIERMYHRVGHRGSMAAYNGLLDAMVDFARQVTR